MKLIDHVTSTLGEFLTARRHRVYTVDVHVTALALDAYSSRWYERVDLTLLDMDDVHRCVAGQVFDGYDAGLARLTRGATPQFGGSVARAFDGSCPASLWHDEVLARRRADDARASTAALDDHEARTGRPTYRPRVTAS